jgi:hypothetical protein
LKARGLGHTFDVTVDPVMQAVFKLVRKNKKPTQSRGLSFFEQSLIEGDGHGGGAVAAGRIDDCSTWNKFKP